MSLVKNVYLMLKEDTETHFNYNGKNWTFQIKDMLQTFGLGFVWEQQFHIEIPFTLIKQRLIDNCLQKWYAEINNSSRLQSYCISNTTLKLKVTIIRSLKRNTELHYPDSEYQPII